MTPNSVPARYTEQEQGHWRFAAHGIRWTTLGVGLTGLAMVLVLVMSGLQAAISTPRNAGAARGMIAGWDIIIQVLLFGSAACSILSFFALLIGLTLSCFTPRPSIARYFSLGALAMLIMSHVSVGQGVMLQFNTMQRAYGMGGMDNMGMDDGFFAQVMVAFSSYYLTALAEYFLSIVLICSFIMAVAAEFRQQQTIQGAQTYLKMLFAIPVILAALGISIFLTASARNAATSFLPLVGVVLMGVVYVWMCYSLLKLLQQTSRAISSEIDPQDWNPNLPTATPAVIDPLAD